MSDTLIGKKRDLAWEKRKFGRLEEKVKELERRSEILLSDADDMQCYRELTLKPQLDEIRGLIVGLQRQIDGEPKAPFRENVTPEEFLDDAISSIENQIRMQESVLTKLKMRLEDLKKDRAQLEGALDE